MKREHIASRKRPPLDHDVRGLAAVIVVLWSIRNALAHQLLRAAAPDVANMQPERRT